MRAEKWIPKPNDLVEYNGKLYTFISMSMGGECKIKIFTTTKRITKKLTVDILKLTKTQ